MTTATSARPGHGGFRHGLSLAEGLGYDVTYVRNITDIDDKIIKRAIENGESDPATDRSLHRRHARGCRRWAFAPRPRAARARVVPEMQD
jgi:cysteinyl-tRNA synthetase